MNENPIADIIGMEISDFEVIGGLWSIIVDIPYGFDYTISSIGKQDFLANFQLRCSYPRFRFGKIILVPGRRDNFCAVYRHSRPLRTLVSEESENRLVSLCPRLFVAGKDSIAHFDFFDWFQSLFRFNKRTFFEALEALYDIACRNGDGRERKARDNCVYKVLRHTIRKALPCAISYTNQAIVERVDYIISGVAYDWGGAWTACEYARRKKKIILNVIEGK